MPRDMTQTAPHFKSIMEDFDLIPKRANELKRFSKKSRGVDQTTSFCAASQTFFKP